MTREKTTVTNALSYFFPLPPVTTGSDPKQVKTTSVQTYGKNPFNSVPVAVVIRIVPLWAARGTTEKVLYARGGIEWTMLIYGRIGCARIYGIFRRNISVLCGIRVCAPRGRTKTTTRPLFTPFGMRVFLFFAYTRLRWREPGENGGRGEQIFMCAIYIFFPGKTLSSRCEETLFLRNHLSNNGHFYVCGGKRGAKQCVCVCVCAVYVYVCSGRVGRDDDQGRDLRESPPPAKITAANCMARCHLHRVQ